MPFVRSRMGCSIKSVEMMAPVQNSKHPTGSRFLASQGAMLDMLDVSRSLSNAQC